MSLTFDDLRDANSSRVSSWFPEGFDEWTLSEWAVEHGGEMGEALNVIKKLNRVTRGLKSGGETEAELMEMLADELADDAITLDLLAAKAGINLGDAIRRKFNRTSDKYGFKEKL